MQNRAFLGPQDVVPLDSQVQKTILQSQRLWKWEARLLSGLQAPHLGGNSLVTGWLQPVGSQQEWTLFCWLSWWRPSVWSLGCPSAGSVSVFEDRSPDAGEAVCLWDSAQHTGVAEGRACINSRQLSWGQRVTTISEANRE